MRDDFTHNFPLEYKVVSKSHLNVLKEDPEHPNRTLIPLGTHHNSRSGGRSINIQLPGKGREGEGITEGKNNTRGAIIPVITEALWEINPSLNRANLRG